MLNCAGAQNGEKTGILEGKGLVIIATVPPDVVFLEKDGWVDDVVVEVDVIDEELDEVV